MLDRHGELRRSTVSQWQLKDRALQRSVRALPFHISPEH